MIPVGPGLAVRRLALSNEATLQLGLILAGYDGLATIHGERPGVVCIVTTESRAQELDGLLEAFAGAAATRAP